MKKNGFTLIEVIVAVSILAFISMFVAQGIQRGLSARSKIQKDIDRTVALRETLNLISRDVQMAFNYRDINVELYNAAVRQRCRQPSGTPTPTPAGGQPGGGGAGAPTPTPPFINPEDCKEKEHKIVTHFVGEEDRVNFTTLSHVRRRKNDPTSDQAEVGYYLAPCRARLTGEDAGQCLWRRLSPILDDNVEEGGTTSVLIEHVRTLAFRYLPAGQDEWTRVWNSRGTTDSTQGGKFPAAVEVTLEIFDRQFNPPKEVGMTVVAPLRFPNNPKEDSNAQTTPGL